MTAGASARTLPGMHTTHRPPLAAILVVPLIAALVLTLFAWPSARVGPRDLPVGVVGAQPLAAPGFDVHRYAGEAEAREAIEEREVYGAAHRARRSWSPRRPRPWSPRCSPTPPHGAPGRGRRPRPAREQRARAPPCSRSCWRGSSPACSRRSPAAGFWRRAGSSSPARADRAGATLIVQSWLGVVGGDWWANGAALSLTVLAIAAVVTGLEALLGQGRHRARRADDDLRRQPVLRRRHLARDAARRARARSASCCRRARAATCCAAPGSSTARRAGGHVAVLAAWALLGLALLAVARLRASGPGRSRWPLKRGDPHLGRASAIRRSGVCGRGTFGEAEGLSPPVALAI